MCCFFIAIQSKNYKRLTQIKIKAFVLTHSSLKRCWKRYISIQCFDFDKTVFQKKKTPFSYVFSASSQRDQSKLPGAQSH